MEMRTISPYDGNTLRVFRAWSAEAVAAAVELAAETAPRWAQTPVAERCALLARAGAVLRSQREDFARLITEEMGKLIGEARAEVDKCASACDYYAEHGPALLAEESVASDAARSYVAYQPLGTVLAVMPWNFPFWQVFRFAVPALLAGNTALLKHASNVPQCALAVWEVFKQAGFPRGVFQSLLIGAAAVEDLIHDPRVHAVTVTGSEATGRAVAAQAGASLKKTVLELGGSDAFIVLPDADLDLAVATAVIARFLNAGQSCIAAKRFIVVHEVADAFLARFKEAVERLMPGDPLDETTSLAPMARHDLRDDLHRQVLGSIARGAVAVTGCTPGSGPGAFYEASILDRVVAGMPAYEQELFGPVAAVIRVHDEAEALQVANASRYGLGGSVWTTDLARGERIAHALACGSAFVNGLVKSDPRLPFGGIKCSGYGRELSLHGVREFLNAKTIWIR